jgi:hypothetical protein
MAALLGLIGRLCRPALNARDGDCTIGLPIRGCRTGGNMGALTSRRSCPDRGRAIVVGCGGMLIDVSAAAWPVGWEHGSTVEAAAHLADW